MLKKLRIESDKMGIGIYENQELHYMIYFSDYDKGNQLNYIIQIL